MMVLHRAMDVNVIVRNNDIFLLLADKVGSERIGVTIVFLEPPGNFGKMEGS